MLCLTTGSVQRVCTEEESGRRFACVKSWSDRTPFTFAPNRPTAKTAFARNGGDI